MKRFFDCKRLIFTALIVLLTLAFVMPQAQAAESWKKRFERFSAVAGETLATGDIVCIKASDSQAYKADANDSNLRPAVGIIGKGGATNATVEIISAGILAGQTAASPGYRLYLSETAGAMTTTAPTNAQVVGWVLPGTTDTATSTKYFIKVVPEPSAGAGF